MQKFCIAVLMSFMTFTTSFAGDSTIIGKSIQPFMAPTAQGGQFTFDAFPDAKAIALVFTCNHCPFAELYIQRMNDFYREYTPKGIPLIAINPMDSILYEDETLEEMRTKVLRDSLIYPYLQDHSQSIARTFNAAFTPQVFVIQKKANAWKIVYQGIIDDNGKYPDKAKHYLKETAEAILSDISIPQEVIASFGCKIIYRSP